MGCGWVTNPDEVQPGRKFGAVLVQDCAQSATDTIPNNGPTHRLSDCVPNLGVIGRRGVARRVSFGWQRGFARDIPHPAILALAALSLARQTDKRGTGPNRPNQADSL